MIKRERLYLKRKERIMQNMVWKLTRTNYDWDQGAMSQLTDAGVVSEMLPKYPRTMIAHNKPTNGKTLETVISGAIYAVTEVEYAKRWDD
jgi:hypothetical protein